MTDSEGCILQLLKKCVGANSDTQPNEEKYNPGNGNVGPPNEDYIGIVDPMGEGGFTSSDGVIMRMGRETITMDTRLGGSKIKREVRPMLVPEQLWVDQRFTKNISINGPKALEWKRPRQIAPNPVLYSDGTTRFDISQGNAGTCWFLCILSALADKPEYLKEVIPKGSYKIGTPQYDGVFHCRFWKFGEWVDIYIDDLLPVLAGSNMHWGVKSKTDVNEMWVPLIEKAFAKFHGSYDDADGGWPGNAFISLTGGIAENFNLKENKGQKLYYRMKNALHTGSVVIGAVPQEHDGKMGLTGGHAYTITGLAVVRPTGSQNQVPLLRMRNPWGTRKGEWRGNYSDESPAWNNISVATKNKLNVQNRGDGEFWMSIFDFYRYFTDVQICNFTPDVDKDGRNDNLDKVSCILGEWRGVTAAGGKLNRKFNNPKFMFKVENSNLESDGRLPFVLQLIQYRENCKDRNIHHIRADLYKVEQQFDNRRFSLVLIEHTNNTTFYADFNLSYRYYLEPGHYMVLPTLADEGIENQFLIRLFSNVILPCREIKESVSIRLGRFSTVIDSRN